MDILSLTGPSRACGFLVYPATLSQAKVRCSHCPVEVKRFSEETVKRVIQCFHSISTSLHLLARNALIPSGFVSRCHAVSCWLRHVKSDYLGTFIQNLRRSSTVSWSSITSLFRTWVHLVTSWQVILKSIQNHRQLQGRQWINSHNFTSNSNCSY